MSWDDLITAIQEVAETALEGATQVRPTDLGLDRRAASFLFHGPDFLAVMKSEDRTLQYYGGFEYVDKEYRQEVAEYVFYSTEDERVEGHWSQYEG